jgi:hypothetical protein
MTTAKEPTIAELLKKLESMEKDIAELRSIVMGSSGGITPKMLASNPGASTGSTGGVSALDLSARLRESFESVNAGVSGISLGYVVSDAEIEVKTYLDARGEPIAYTVGQTVDADKLSTMKVSLKAIPK